MNRVNPIVSASFDETPRYLYKIVAWREWEASQRLESLLLPSLDEAFIHLAKQEQLASICAKFWNREPQIAIIKLQVDKLKGELRYELNPGGSNRYYHLYKGSIPIAAVVSVERLGEERFKP